MVWIESVGVVAQPWFCDPDAHRADVGELIMTIDPSPVRAEQNLVIAGPQITCIDCNTSEDLTIESIEPVVPRTDGWVMVEYSCGKCESFYAHEASVQAVARFLTTSDTQPGVLRFGRYYIHCGEPMEAFGLRVTGVGSDDDDLHNVLEVHIPTVVLRCRCGFQMLIPD
ncbi:hypothetical protein CVS28_16900 [Arthrobacter glacialis]|nr:hypothetical protein CVS28_16900 [Arthrobacter glacialis]